MFCTKCGNQIEKDNKFCKSCGNPVKSVTEERGQAQGSAVAPPPVSTPYPPVAGPPATVPKKPPLPRKTLVLIIVGVGIVVLLMVAGIVAVPLVTYNSARKNAQKRTCQSNQRTIEGAINTYWAETEVYPDSIESMTSGKYQVLKIVPRCPTCNKPYELVGSDPPTTSCPGGYPDHAI